MRPPSLSTLLVKYAMMAAVMASVLMLVSGRPEWLRAWAYIAVTLGFQAIAGVLLHRKHPDLLAERSRMQKGTRPWDKVLAPLVAIAGPVALWVVAAWDVRAHWPPSIHAGWSAAALAVCVLGATVTLRAMLANRFFSATVRIQSERGHVVVDSGPYRWVRHPGYLGAIVFTLASPVALGSVYALIPALITAAILAFRAVLEERTLRAELPGYADYMRRVPKRLVPGVW